MRKNLLLLLLFVFSAAGCIRTANQTPIAENIPQAPPVEVVEPEPEPVPPPEPEVPKAPPKVTIAAVGDIMLGNWGEDLIAKNGVNYPFENVAEILQQADIATGNLEGPYCTCGSAMDKKYTFQMKPENLEGIKWAGFDVLTVSNNHAMDFGAECFLQSNNEVQKHGMKICGGGKNLADANKPAVIETNGITVAVLGYSATYPQEAWATSARPGTVFPERSRVISAVSKAAEQYDLVVVHFHWGGEGRQDPKQYQKDLAHLVIDNGADLVIGHHPHILQGIESYNGKLIFYSLGNFTFASYSKRAKTSAIAKVTLDKEGNLESASVIPVNVFNYEVNLQPRPIPGDPAILSELRQISGMIGQGTPATIADDGTLSIQ